MILNPKKLFIATTLCLCLSLSTTSVLSDDSVTKMPLKEIQELAQVLELIKKNHVTEQSDQALLLAAINGMLGSLDDQSRYLTAEELKIFTKVATGSKQGNVTTDGRLLADSIAYLDVNYFHATTADRITSLWQMLGEQTTKGLILDFRDNPGGFVESAVAVSDLFQAKGLITSSRGRIAEASRNYTATAATLEVKVPIIILVNSQTASAAEIVAATLQDNQLAILVGAQTYGKGSIQSLLYTKYGAIQLTTAYYYSPNGRMIHEKGISPDILLGHDQQEKMMAGGNKIEYHHGSDEEYDWQLHWVVHALKQDQITQSK